MPLDPHQALALIKKHGGVRAAARAIGVDHSIVSRAAKRASAAARPATTRKTPSASRQPSLPAPAVAPPKRDHVISLDELRAAANPVALLIAAIERLPDGELRHESCFRSSLRFSDRIWRKLKANKDVRQRAVIIRGLNAHPDGTYFARKSSAMAARAELLKANLL